MPSPSAEPATRKRRRHAWFALAAMMAAWLFGAGARFAWHHDDTTAPPRVDGQPLLVTPDAFHYGAGVQQQIADTHAANPRVPNAGDNVIIAVASFMVTTFGLSVDAACYWAPAILAPLVAIPLVVLGLLFGHLLGGFLAALVASIGFQYWARTIPGYFDTDSISVAYVLVAHAVAIRVFICRSRYPGLAAGLLATLAPWVHPGSERILVVLMLAVCAYTVLFARTRADGYRLGLALGIALSPLPMWLKAPLIVAVEIIFSHTTILSRLRVMPRPMVIGAAVAILAGVIALLAFTTAGQRVLMLVGVIGDDRGNLVPGLQFGNVADFVIEQRPLAFSELAELTTGHPFLFVTGLVGLGLLTWRHRQALLLLPLLILGTAIAATSIRYTIYAVPLLALGNGILAHTLAGRLVRTFVSPTRPRFAKATLPILTAMFGAAPVAMAVTFASDFKRVAYLPPPEAVLMRSVDRAVKSGDFLLSWWDTAYPIWYFTGGRSLVDGSKHDEDLWIMAEIMLSPSQRASAGLARLAVEHQVRQPPLTPVIDDILGTWTRAGGTIADFVPALRDGRMAIPPATRDIFVYMPLRLFDNFRSMLAMRMVAGLLPQKDLDHERIFAATPILGPTDDAAPTWRHDREKQVVVHTSGHIVPVHTIHSTWGPTDASGTFDVTDEVVNPKGRAFIIEHRHRNLRLVMDAQLQASTWTQALLLNRADPAFFEPVRRMAAGAIYRIRR